MGEPWSFTFGPRLLFGSGMRQQLGRQCRPIGERVALVTGGRSLQRAGHEAELLHNLADAGCRIVAHGRIDKEPAIVDIDALAATCRTGGAELVVAIGGGSVLDAAKALAGLLTNDGSVRDYLEGLQAGGGRTFTNDPLPLVAVPTTAGTGSEATANAVIQVTDEAVKRSLRDDRLRPVLALVDPDFLQGADRYRLGCAGLDACAHLLESYLSSKATPLTDQLAWAGLERAWPAVQELAATHTLGESARNDLALAASWGGVCLANARLGAAHGLVAALCGRLPQIGHGHGVARLTGPALLTNYAACAAAGQQPALGKIDRLIELLVPGGDAPTAAAAVQNLCDSLGITPLADHGLNEDLYAAIAAKPSGSIATNPVALRDEQLQTILAGARDGR